jgi:hypothetical protein
MEDPRGSGLCTRKGHSLKSLFFGGLYCLISAGITLIIRGQLAGLMAKVAVF